MSVIVLFQDQRGRELESLPNDVSSLSTDSLLWIDLDPDDPLLEDLAKEFALSDEAAAALRKPTAKPSFVQEKEFIYLTIFGANLKVADLVVPLECVVGENWVITSHQKRLSLLDQFKDSLTGWGQVNELDGLSFLSTLLRWIIDGYRDAFEQIECELEELGNTVLERRDGQATNVDAAVDKLIQARKQIGVLRRALAAHRGPFLALAEPRLDILSTRESGERFENLLRQVDNCLTAASDARDLIASSFDILIARSEHKTNQIVKTLTVISILLLPGTLIAGLMGMNFKVGIFNDPENFWYIVTGIVVIMVGSLVVVRLRHWL